MPLQISKGETFTSVSPGKSVTATRLNDHVDSATLLPGAITEQSENTTLAGDDLLLGNDTSSSSALRKIAVATVRALPTEYAAGVYSGGVYTVTLSPAVTAYVTGMRILFKADTVNAGNTNVIVNALASKDLFKQYNVELAAGDILQNQIIEAVYDGVAFQIQSPPSAALTASALAQAAQGDVHQYAAGTLSGGVYSVALSPARSGAYVAGEVVRFKADTANSGACDVNVNSRGAANLYRGIGLELLTGDIIANQLVTAVYDGSNFQVLQTIPKASISANTALPAAGATTNVAHSLTIAPRSVRVVLVCVTNDAATGYLTTDGEIELVGAIVSGGQSILSVRSDATNVMVLRNSIGGGLYLMHKTTGVTTNATSDANFNFKVYASL